MERRAFLLALGAVALGGCTPSPAPLPTPTASPTPPPDAMVLSSWWRAERRAADLYSRAAAAYEPLRANHLARLDAVAAHLASLGVPVPTPSAAPVAGLIETERELSAAYLRDLAAVTSPVVAVLGAELAAGARQHLVVLGLVKP